MIPRVRPDVYGPMMKEMEEKGLGSFLVEFVTDQPDLALAFFDMENTNVVHLVMLYKGIKSQMEADELC